MNWPMAAVVILVVFAVMVIVTTYLATRNERRDLG